MKFTVDSTQSYLAHRGSSPKGSGFSGALVRVLDDDGSIRRSLSRLFRSAKIPVETFGSLTGYLESPVHEGPCCLVLEVQMQGVDGLHLQELLAGSDTQIVFLTRHGDVPRCARAMKAGAVDFLTKPVNGSVLLSAVSRALKIASELRRSRAEKDSARDRLNKLTPRELEVMQHVIAGLLNKQIAAALGAAEKTIKVHRGRVMEKMGVGSLAELVRVAQKAGVFPSGQL